MNILSRPRILLCEEEMKYHLKRHNGLDLTNQGYQEFYYVRYPKLGQVNESNLIWRYKRKEFPTY